MHCFLREQHPVGSGGGSVGRAVAYDTRGPWFESQHRQIFIDQLKLNRIDENKEKEAGNGPSLKNVQHPVGVQVKQSIG